MINEDDVSTFAGINRDTKEVKFSGNEETKQKKRIRSRSRSQS